MASKSTVKEQVISILDQHKGQFYSGQELADTIGVSRNAIWKAINSLREQGFTIEGSTKNGYSLAEVTDILNKSTIENGLSQKARKFYDIKTLDVTSSTNDLLKVEADNNAKEGTTIIAAKQTAGKGRKGRSFFSPESTGLYMSVLLRPDLEVEDAVLITTAAAVAASKACENVNHNLSEGDVKIKWVNDLFLNNRKFVGILTEASLSMETRKLDYAVLGIGFNIASPIDGWPEEIKDIAGSLFDKTAPIDTRNRLAAEFLNEFLDIYEHLPDVTYLDEYRSRSNVIGKDVDILEAGMVKGEAKVIGIDDKCQLQVKLKGQEEITILNSGEISVR